MDETWQDILTRYKRMQGYAALWVPGTDHASIATEAKVVAKMREEGLTKEDGGPRRLSWSAPGIGRTPTADRIVEPADESWAAPAIGQRERFTMDEGCSNAVKEVFVQPV